MARLRLTPAAQDRMIDYARHRTALLTEALAQLDPDARAALEAAVPHLDRLAVLLRGPA